MAHGLNKVLIIGTVGRDPEMRYTPSGKPVTSFSIAVTRTWKAGNGDQREETEWFNIVAWGGLAEICRSQLKKDGSVYIEGRLQTRGWEDENGKKHFRTEVVANEMIMLGDRETTNDDDAPDEEGDDYAF